MINAFSVDVEDYFHPSEVARAAPMKHWPAFPPRLDLGINILLNQLDRAGARATFFVLGWVAEKHPNIVKRIADAGHEIGCHSYQHRLVYDLTPSEFREDTRRACAAIQDACGRAPRAYRAPSYSIVAGTLWALEILAECGFTHDSSIFPIVHDRYGIPGYKRHAHRLYTPSGPLIEVPAATVQLRSGRIAPVGGGAYLRLFPYRYTAAGIRRLNGIERQPACIYVHPWELDPEQPRLARGLISRFRTYAGIGTVERKVNMLLEDFQFSSLESVYAMPTLASAATMGE
jgi:polysaccharide deacetylase family protein (PEP-CTERM system associated)